MISRASARMFVAICQSAALLTGPTSSDALANDKSITAIELYQTRANQGVAYAQYILGWAYLDGDGAPRDHVAAYKWFAIAAAGGFSLADEILDDVERRLTPAQLAEAKQLAEAWNPVE